jgi:hypothetical protein
MREKNTNSGRLMLACAPAKPAPIDEKDVRGQEPQPNNIRLLTAGRPPRRAACGRRTPDPRNRLPPRTP